MAYAFGRRQCSNVGIPAISPISARMSLRERFRQGVCRAGIRRDYTYVTNKV